MKTCTKCKIEKELNEFHRSKRERCGLNSQCKKCRNESTSKWAKTNRGRELHKLTESIRRSRDKKSIILSGAKQRAKRNKLDFDLTKDDIKFVKFCPVLGIELNYNSSKLCDNSPTLDRIDSAKGYIKTNIKIISWRANRLKCDSTIEEMEKILSYMYDNFTNLYRNNLGVKKGLRPTKFYTWNNQSKSLTDWAEEYKMNYSTLNNRVNRLKWPLEKALTTPVLKKNKYSKNKKV